MRLVDRIFGSRYFHPAAISLLALSILVVYSNTFYSTFHFDDFSSIVDNEKIRDLSSAATIFTKGVRGISFYSFALNHFFDGYNVLGYHIFNTSVHIISSVLFYILLYLTLFKLTAGAAWSKRIAFFSALIFAVHPVQTQAVTYIVQRMESLSGLFFLAGLVFFVYATVGRKRKGGWLRFVPVPICYALAFYSKEITITMPAVVLIYDFCFIGGRSLRSLIPRWPLYAVLSVLFVYFAISTVAPQGGFNELALKVKGVQSSSELAGGDLSLASGDTIDTGGETVVTGGKAVDVPKGEGEVEEKLPTAGFGLRDIGPKQYLITQFNVMTYYMVLLAFPMEQNADYDFPLSESLFKIPHPSSGVVLNSPIPPPVVSLAVILTLIAIALYFLVRKSGPATPRRFVVAFFILWFFIILSPTSSFIPIMDLIFEHRLYLASAGFFVTEVIVIDWLISRLTGGSDEFVAADVV